MATAAQRASGRASTRVRRGRGGAGAAGPGGRVSRALDAGVAGMDATIQEHMNKLSYVDRTAAFARGGRGPAP
ncbi:hypothetical protein GCM10010505_62950 [Kitasatospora aburaviensis]